jgi:hypothetical protein
VTVGAGQKIVIWFYMSLIADAACEADFAIAISGTTGPIYSATYIPNGANATSASLIYEQAIVAGTYTITAQWKSPSGISLHCNPAAASDNQGAALTVAVVSV